MRLHDSTKIYSLLQHGIHFDSTFLLNGGVNLGLHGGQHQEAHAPSESNRRNQKGRSKGQNSHGGSLPLGVGLGPGLGGGQVLVHRWPLPVLDGGHASPLDEAVQWPRGEKTPRQHGLK